MPKREQPAAKNAYQSDEYYKHHYGNDVVITRLGRITIVHLDQPSREIIKRRTKEVMRETITGEDFDDDCPLCREMKNQQHDIVYYRQDR